MYENTSYGGRKRCKGCTVLNRLRERDASFDRISMCWQSDNRQSDVLEVIVMKSWQAVTKIVTFSFIYNKWHYEKA